MEIEKDLAENEDTIASNSDAVQVTPELPGNKTKITKSTETSSLLATKKKQSDNKSAQNNIVEVEEPATIEIGVVESEVIEKKSKQANEEDDSPVNVKLNEVENLSPESNLKDLDNNLLSKQTKDNTSTKNTEIISSEDLETKSGNIENENLSNEKISTSQNLNTSIPIEEEKIDYPSLGKEELLNCISEIAENFIIKKAGDPTNQIRDTFNVIIHEEETIALNKFIKNGGVKEDFKFSPSDSKIKFDKYYKIIKEKRDKYYKNLEKDKNQNLKIKNELLKRLREIVDNEESSSISALKKLQKEWKAVGPILPQYNKTLWANYHALLNRFYDHRSIYFELKDLDRKKNLEAKLELCQKAEALDKEKNITSAIKKLNDLHEEFKHLGPVPKEEQENLWQKFKTASEVLYLKRKEYATRLVGQLKENLVKKLELVDEINTFLSFTSDSISEWNNKAKELFKLQKKWNVIGGIPRKDAKEVNKKFWKSFKQFYHNKNTFFKTLESQNEANLESKQALVDKAEQLKDNQDWDNTSNELIKLQNEWYSLGPVSEKYNNIHKKFKTACDTFFNNRRNHYEEQEAKYEDNLTKKEEICNQLEKMVSNLSLEDSKKIYELQATFNALGFVPRKAIKKIQNRYKGVLQAMLDKAKDMGEENFDTFKTILSIKNMHSKFDTDKKIEHQEYGLRRKIINLENDVSTWKNNMTFFANSKNTIELIKGFEQKIINAEKNIMKLKRKLKLLSQI